MIEEKTSWRMTNSICSGLFFINSVPKYVLKSDRNLAIISLIQIFPKICAKIILKNATIKTLPTPSLGGVKIFIGNPKL